MEKLRSELRELSDVNRMLKNLSSRKCNLNKKFKWDKISKDSYEVKMLEIVELENKVKMIRDELNGGSKKSYLDLSEEEISKLSYDELEKGIRSIDSIKCRDYDRVDICESKKDIFKKYKNLNGNKNKGLVRISSVKEVLECINNNNIEDVNIVKEMLLKIIE